MSEELKDLYKEMRSLYHTARVVRTAHFLAAQGDQRMQRILGTSVIVLNIMILSPLFDLIAPNYYVVIIKFLAIFAASFAALQTLFGFQKDSESHLSAGDAYGSICRKLQILLAEYKDGTKAAWQTLYEFKALNAEYLQANKDFKNIIPSEREYAKARRTLKALDAKRRTEGEPNTQLTSSEITTSAVAAGHPTTH